MSGLLLKSNHVDNCDFSGSDVSSRIENSHLANNLFKNCSLKETEFSRSYFEGCDFSGADFTGVQCKSGGFGNNTVANAVWNRTSFIDTYIADIIFDSALEDCYFENCSFARVLFQNLTLINTFFKNNSLKKIQFIDCQTDRMTYEFLKNESGLEWYHNINIAKELIKMLQNEIAISAQGLKKSYKNIPVLEGVDFQVKTGSIFALLGSNGAGKTTIVKILTTLLKQDSGNATVNGFDVISNPGNVRQSISLTGQFAAVDEVLTGRENLIMIARLRHLSNPHQVADGLIKRFGLSDAADRRASTYSGGMRRRLDIAMSLVGKPQLIFLDEPTTGLDPEARIEVWKIERARW
jgi:ABC-2 type transport system ATP-binding protein